MGFLSKMKKEMKELVEKMAGNDERRVFAHYMVSQPMPWSHPVHPGTHSVCRFMRSFIVDILLSHIPIGARVSFAGGNATATSRSPSRAKTPTRDTMTGNAEH